VVPGSSSVKRAAEAAGLDRVFREAGFFWGESGCSMCAGGNGDIGEPGERCVSTTNRNFENRQGPKVRTHLASPATAAASAIAGRIADRLSHHYGEDSVFMDVESIPIGIDFRTHIDETLQQADVVLAVIGRNWLGQDAAGAVRISLGSAIAQAAYAVAVRAATELLTSGTYDSVAGGIAYDTMNDAITATP